MLALSQYLETTIIISLPPVHWAMATICTWPHCADWQHLNAAPAMSSLPLRLYPMAGFAMRSCLLAPWRLLCAAHHDCRLFIFCPRQLWLVPRPGPLTGLMLFRFLQALGRQLAGSGRAAVRDIYTPQTIARIIGHSGQYYGPGSSPGSHHWRVMVPHLGRGLDFLRAAVTPWQLMAIVAIGIPEAPCRPEIPPATAGPHRCSKTIAVHCSDVSFLGYTRPTA